MSQMSNFAVILNSHPELVSGSLSESVFCKSRLPRDVESQKKSGLA